MDPRRPAMLSDQGMIRMIMEGDRHAATLLIQSTEKLVAHIVFKLITEPSARKDLTQDIYLKTFRYLPKFRFQCKLSTWVGQISYTTCIDHLRRRKELVTLAPGNEATDEDIPWQEINPETLDVSQRLSRKERAEILEKLTLTLPPVYRTLITLFHKEELSIDEIMDITPFQNVRRAGKAGEEICRPPEPVGRSLENRAASSVGQFPGQSAFRV